MDIMLGDIHAKKTESFSSNILLQDCVCNIIMNKFFLFPENTAIILMVCRVIIYGDKKIDRQTNNNSGGNAIPILNS
jgi:hypothetical protein